MVHWNVYCMVYESFSGQIPDPESAKFSLCAIYPMEKKVIGEISGIMYKYHAVTIRRQRRSALSLPS